MIKFASIAFIAALTAATPVQAEEAADETVIVVKGMKDPAVIHYRQMLSALSKFSATNPSPRVHMVLRIMPKSEADNAGTIHVVLKGDDGYIRELKSYSGGRIDVPDDQDAVATNADFVIHARPGSIKSRINVVVDGPAGQLSYKQLMDDMRAANDGERALMSPAQRQHFADANTLAVHFTAPAGTITVASDAKGEITLKANQKGVAMVPYDPAVYAENPVVTVSGIADFAMVTTVSSPKWKSH